MITLKDLFRQIAPTPVLLAWKRYHFDENQIIYKGQTYQYFLETAMDASRSEVIGEAREWLIKDIKREFLRNRTRPDEYLLYDFDKKNQVERSKYLPQYLKDYFLFEQPKGSFLFNQLRDKYVFYKMVEPFFKRDVIRISTKSDWPQFESFIKKHKRFICKVIDSGCGVGIRIENAEDVTEAKALFEELVDTGTWIIEELIIQNEEIASFCHTSVNTVRLPSFRHGDNVVQAFPCMRFGREGSIVDNAGQNGLFVSVDIATGVIKTNGFDELGHEYEKHPDSNVYFDGFRIPWWDDLLSMAKQVHLSLPKEHIYVAFDIALSNKGWMIVEGNWGDWVMQQTSLKKGLKNEFVSLLKE